MKKAHWLIFVSAICMTLFSLNTYSAKNEPVRGSRFEKLELFNKVLFLIESQYYREVDTEKLIQGAIRGMMGTLDPHSTFLDEKVFAKMEEDTQGEFGGLGIEVTMKDGILVVTTPIDDTPAFKAGIRPGDKIVEINHESTIGLTLEEAVDKMRGKTSSKITIGIVRENVDGIKRYVLKREIIQVNSVKAELLDNQYIYLRLSQFQKKSYNSIVESIKSLSENAKKHGGAKGIILDLRYNPGGLLEQAIDISSIFLRDGVVVSTEGRNPKDREIHYVKKSGYKELKLPLVVLINGSSASASEIVAGALQDSKRAIIMGSQTFGKGSVQSVAKIDDKMGVKLTIRQYMTPSGKKIQAIGIKPDVDVPEYEAKFVHDEQIQERFVREVDLRGHLNATIETKEEKQLRLEREREERKKRVEAINKLRSKKKNEVEKEKLFQRYNPKEDYQVIQAVNYLKGFTVFKKIKI